MVYTETQSKLSEIVESHDISALKRDFLAFYGDLHDGVIEFPSHTADGGLIETGYYFGDVKPKYIVGVSSQVGCPMKCTFCETGKEPFSRSLTPEEMYEEVVLMLQTAKGLGVDIDSKRHKVTVAKTGEPLFNKTLVDALEMISGLDVSFKVSTVFPAAESCFGNFRRLAEFASWYDNSVQPQISVISTSENYRLRAAGKAAPFSTLRKAGELWRNLNPEGRKVNLSLILTEQVPCDVNAVFRIFPPELFKFRFRNYVPTKYGNDNSLTTISREKITRLKQDFMEKGYDVDSWGTPTPTEQKFGLASNVTRRRYIQITDGQF